ncbi:hypothetical protein VVD49_16765 [Uliginosibacterium sp. H3]|uniref:Uncharacterized protein n=1 Tax=Uliginosibacterium silvisoli TaxID=3114758 RepID=A0ABU6K665_9RHOO|nr:hypothetical protein [Uliginosibacterium sp. H3]
MTSLFNPGMAGLAATHRTRHFLPYSQRSLSRHGTAKGRKSAIGLKNTRGIAADCVVGIKPGRNDQYDRQNLPRSGSQPKL